MKNIIIGILVVVVIILAIVGLLNKQQPELMGMPALEGEVVATNNDLVSDNMNGSASVTFEPTEAELEVSPAYVRSVSQDGSNYEIVVDYIQILPYQQGNPNPMGEIVNNNPMLRTFTLTPDTQFVFQTRSNDPVSGNFNYNESVDFQTATTTLAAWQHLVGNETGVPFMITVDLNTNEVVSLIEIYTS